jgi:hypothetical protein
MVDDMLTLTTVQVAREVVTPDGMGAFTTTTTLTTLAKSAIWQAGANLRYLSDKLAKASTHVLACKTSGYTWAENDMKVVYGGSTYKVVGRADDVMNRAELTIVGLERIT